MTLPMPLAAEAVPRRALGCRARRYRGSLLVANADQAFELDELAEFVFRDIDGARTVHQLGERLAVRYDLPVDQAIADTADLVHQLVVHRVLDVSPED
ncbi:PqqD family protein [Saccharothrix sp. NRRL B-16314]|uniref:PqqD family protein n=1 Tax=Saccharothrix sp. NRRL B-16314 TaxID=1463825 RepID=UPI0005272848|nr:PqqD family protein [Saccharothrix sp. NRRL B-16314]